MKKTLKFSALICALAMTFSIGFTTAFAASRTETVLDDTFSDSTFEGAIDTGKWNATFTTATQTIKQQDTVENASLQFIKGMSGCEWVQYGTKQKLTNIVSVEYSFMVPQTAKKNTWFGITFAPSIDTSNPGWYPYDANLKLEANIQGNDFLGKWVSVKFVPSADGMSADVYYAQRQEDGTVNYPTEKQLTANFNEFHSIDGNNQIPAEEKDAMRAEKIAKEGWSYKNAVILWGCEGQGEGICLDDVKITTQAPGADPVVYENTFESLDLYGDNSDFRAYEGHGRPASVTLMVAEDNKMLFTNVKEGDRIISFEKISQDDSVVRDIKCVEMSFNVRLAKNTSDAIAFAFGLEDENADPTQNGTLYVIQSDSVSGKATGKLVSYKNGEKVAEQTTAHELDKVTGKDGARITLAVYKDGTVSVKRDGNTVSEEFKVESYAGAFGFYATKNNDSVVYVDNVMVSNVTYYVPTTKSVTHNFENNFFGNKGFEDFFMRAEGGKIEVKNGKLAWSSCSDYSYFGSAYEYDGFILDYQISSIFVTNDRNDIASGATLPDTWTGLDIGRTRLTENHYGSHILILFTVNPTSNTVRPGIYINEERSLIEYADVVHTVFTDIPKEWFTDIHYGSNGRTEVEVLEEDALCVRFVSDPKTESVRLYMKKLGSTEYTLISETFVNATGYAALTCTGYLSMNMDNFSMSNTSPIYNLANNEIPETIYPDPEVEYIYTKPDVDVNLDEEIKLNLGGKLSWLWLIGGLVVGLGGLGAGFLLLLKAKKLAGQPATEKVVENEGNGEDL